jgi:ATP-dependent Lon protease
MGRSQTATLPLIPLPRGTVLLPGLAYRVTVNSSRPDLPALLAYVYELAASKGPDGRIDSIPIACVPVSSPLVGPDGQLLITSGEDPESARVDTINPGTAKKDDLFGFGVAAKIVGIDGRGSGEFALRVEGTSRIRLDAIVRERPFFEAKATYYEDEGRLSDIHVPSLGSLCLVSLSFGC